MDLRYLRLVAVRDLDRTEIVLLAGLDAVALVVAALRVLAAVRHRLHHVVLDRYAAFIYRQIRPGIECAVARRNVYVLAGVHRLTGRCADLLVQLHRERVVVALAVLVVRVVPRLRYADLRLLRFVAVLYRDRAEIIDLRRRDAVALAVAALRVLAAVRHRLHHVVLDRYAAFIYRQIRPGIECAVARRNVYVLAGVHRLTGRCADLLVQLHRECVVVALAVLVLCIVPGLRYMQFRRLRFVAVRDRIRRSFVRYRLLVFRRYRHLVHTIRDLVISLFGRQMLPCVTPCRCRRVVQSHCIAVLRFRSAADRLVQLHLDCFRTFAVLVLRIIPHLQYTHVRFVRRVRDGESARVACDSHRIAYWYRILFHAVCDLRHRRPILAVLGHILPGVAPRDRRVVSPKDPGIQQLFLAAADLPVQLHRHALRLESGRRSPFFHYRNIDRLRRVRDRVAVGHVARHFGSVSRRLRFLCHRVHDRRHGACAVLPILWQACPLVAPVRIAQRDVAADLRLVAAADLLVQLHRHGRRTDAELVIVVIPGLYNFDVYRLRRVLHNDRPVLSRYAYRIVLYTVALRYRIFDDRVLDQLDLVVCVLIILRQTRPRRLPFVVLAQRRRLLRGERCVVLQQLYRYARRLERRFRCPLLLNVYLHRLRRVRDRIPGGHAARHSANVTHRRILFHGVRDRLHVAGAVLCVLRQIVPGVAPFGIRCSVQRHRIAALFLFIASDRLVQLYRHAGRTDAECVVFILPRLDDGEGNDLVGISEGDGRDWFLALLDRRRCGQGAVSVIGRSHRHRVYSGVIDDAVGGARDLLHRVGIGLAHVRKTVGEGVRKRKVRHGAVLACRVRRRLQYAPVRIQQLEGELARRHGAARHLLGTAQGQGGGGVVYVDQGSCRRPSIRDGAGQISGRRSLRPTRSRGLGHGVARTYRQARNGQVLAVLDGEGDLAIVEGHRLLGSRGVFCGGDCGSVVAGDSPVVLARCDGHVKRGQRERQTAGGDGLADLQ